MGQLNDNLYSYLTSLGYSGTVNDMMYRYLDDEGYSGALNDKLYHFLKDGGYRTFNDFMQNGTSLEFFQAFSLTAGVSSTYTGYVTEEILTPAGSISREFNPAHKLLTFATNSASGNIALTMAGDVAQGLMDRVIYVGSTRLELAVLPEYNAGLDFTYAEYTGVTLTNTTVYAITFAQLGAELLANFDFINGDTGWTKTGSVTSSYLDDVLTLTRVVGYGDRMRQTISVVSGRNYLFRAWVANGTMDCTLVVNANAVNPGAGPNPSNFKMISYVYAAGASASVDFDIGVGGNGNGRFDWVSLREIL